MKKKAIKIIGVAAAVILILPVVALALLIALYDFNGARPWINDTISAALDRKFRIDGDIDVHWVRRIENLHYRLPRPRLSVDRIVIGNPDWARQQPFAKVGNITVVFDPLMLIHKAVALPLVDVDHAVVNLERRADGRNNWTFGKDEPGVSTWRVAPGALRIRESRVTLADAKHQLALRAEADSYDQGLRWSAEGTLNGEALRGEGMAGSLLALQDTETPYPIAFTLDAGETHVQADGTLTNPTQLAALNVKLALSGASMSDLYQLTKIVLPSTAPYATHGRLVGTLNEWGGTWSYEKFNGHVGNSDLSGTLTWAARAQKVPLLHGALRSRLLDFVDLGPLIGMDSGSAVQPEEQREAQAANVPVLPSGEFETERLKSIDADVRFDAERIVVKSELPFNNLHASIKLTSGVLTLEPLTFGIADGELASRLRLDARQRPPLAEVNIDVDSLKLRELIPATNSEQASLGQVNGSVAVTGRGNSVAELLGEADGEVRLFIDRGRISRFILEAAGLNILNAVVTRLFDDSNTVLHCAAAYLPITDGVMQSEAFIVDTAQAVIDVDGRVDLGAERLDLTLRPQSKGVRVLSLRAPIHIQGSFREPDINIDKGALALRAGGAAALGAVAPIAALLPLISPGEDALPEENGCSALLAKARRQADLAESGSGDGIKRYR